MKNFLTARTLLALALTTGLAACGAGNKTYVLGGAVTGLTDPAGLVLVNTTSGATVTIPANATGYAFADKLSYGTVFNVTVKLPQPPHQTCTPTSVFTGSAGTTSTSSINIVCVQNSYLLGGTVTGLTGTGLQLTNGADVLAIAPTTPPSASAPFTFAGRVFDSAAYGVTVLAQPTNPAQVCKILSGASGLMGTADVTNVQVACQ